MRVALIAAVASVLLLGTGPRDARAATGAVRFDMAECFVEVDFQRSWRARGAVHDLGEWTSRRLSTTIVGARERQRFRSVLVGERGTIVMRWYRWLEPAPGGLLWSHGGWYAVRGTGAYAGIAGRGWFTDTFPLHEIDCIDWTFRGTLTRG